MESCPRGRRSTIGNRVGGDKLSQGFKSLALRHLIKISSWPVGQAVKTPPFHGGNTGSNPVRVTIYILRRISSAGRASALQAEGRRFDPVILHHITIAGWSSLVARRAHNPKVAGSNPAPAIEKVPWCSG